MLYHIGQSYLQINNLTCAIDFLNQAIILNREHFAAHYYLGLAHYMEADYVHALVYLDIALDLQPHNLEALQLKAQALIPRGLDHKNIKGIIRLMTVFRKHCG